MQTTPGRVSVLVLAAAGVLALLPAWAADQAGPRAVRFTTEGAYEADKVPAYTGRHQAAYAYIDAHQSEEHLENLRRWVRQPSVSAQGRDIPRKLSGHPPAQTSVEAPFVQAVIGVFKP